MFSFIKKKKAKPEETKEQPFTRKAFDQREKVYPLSLFVTIVGREQSRFFVDSYATAGASLSMVIYSFSMPPDEVMRLLGNDNTKKDMVFTVVRTEDIPKLKKIAVARFAISRAAKGIAFAVPIDSVSGIAVYKFLADQNKEVRTNVKHG